MRFFVGLHQPSDAKRIKDVFISVNRLRTRRSDINAAGDWIMDSGAFTTIAKRGCYPEPPEVYAAEVRRWSKSPGLLAAVSQDYMCEPSMLARTGLTIADHQRLTIERYDAIRAAGTGDTYLMPVLQGYGALDYSRHVAEYGARLLPGAWVGVGSVCKRNGNPSVIGHILATIHRERPDLRLHGFGLKKTSLQVASIVDMLYSADSMAWSYAARRETGRQNKWQEAVLFSARINQVMTPEASPQLELAFK